MLFDENIYFAGLTVSVMLLTNIELFCRQRLESFTGSRSEDRGVSQCAKRRRGVSGCVCVCACVCEALCWCEVVTGQSTGQGKNITDLRGLLFVHTCELHQIV